MGINMTERVIGLLQWENVRVSGEVIKGTDSKGRERVCKVYGKEEIIDIGQEADMIAIQQESGVIVYEISSLDY
jgi:hypothetical protein